MMCAEILILDKCYILLNLPSHSFFSSLQFGFLPHRIEIEIALVTFILLNLVHTLLLFSFFFFFFNFIYLFLAVLGLRFFLCEGFLQLRRVGAILHRGAQASHYRGLSCCGAQAPDAQAQQLWLTGPVAPWHVGSSQTRVRTHVPCIGRQILNHCATREAPLLLFSDLRICSM